MTNRVEEIKDGLYEYTIDGDTEMVRRLTEEGVALEIPPLDMLYGALIPALEEVGRLFERGQYFVPEMLIAAKAMQAAMDILRPLLVKSGIKPVGTAVMLTVKGDMHDIGKNLVNMMLESSGFHVIDLGINTPPEKMIAAIKEHKPDLVGFSAFLTTTMPMFKLNIAALKKAGLRDQVKVIVGGAPVNQAYADQVEADGYAPDASSAVRLAKRLLGMEGATGSEVKSVVERAAE